jgi:hypothetical protein
VLPEQGIVYQFILAIEDAYPNEARDIYQDLRQNKALTLEKLIAELNDEARRSDPVKAAAFAAKNNATTTDNTNAQRSSSRGYGGRGRGSSCGGRGGNCSSSFYRANSKTTTPPARAQLGGRLGVSMCLHCSREHASASDRC